MSEEHLVYILYNFDSNGQNEYILEIPMVIQRNIWYYFVEKDISYGLEHKTLENYNSKSKDKKEII